MSATARRSSRSSRRRLAVLCVLVPLAVGVLPADPAPAASGYSYADRVVDLTNRERMRHGCPPLRVSRALSRAALRHGYYLADRSRISHRGRGGSDSEDRIRAAGYRAKRTGENIAAGITRPRAVVRAWMRSPSHRANILDCRLRHVGVAEVYEPRSAHGYYWVQNFGTR
ncbi:CAP domain-containing protein [Streptomyces sp. NPDC059637]|uniref:CAP domain-containing protein n=1 Tax=Streptomyces sp. NPDC059637 TaxID=3347752 RepID=UPI00368A1C99